MPFEHQPPCVVYSGSTAVGWCRTWQEADAVCERRPELQWGVAKRGRKGRSGDVQQIVLSASWRGHNPAAGAP